MTFAKAQTAYYTQQGYQANLAPFEALGAAIASDATTKIAFLAKYPATLSNQDFIASIYTVVTGGTAPTFTGAAGGSELTNGDHYIKQLAFYTNLYQSTGLSATDAALQARGAIAGQITALPYIDSSVAGSSTLDDQTVQFLTQAAAGTATYGAPLPPASGNVGTTFTLTSGIDAGAAFTGTANADTFNAFTNNAATPADTLTAFDSLDGGGGIDTLQITSTLTAAFAAIPANASIKNIEVINVQTASTAGVTVAADSVVGATNLNVAALTATSTTVTTKGNVATVTVAAPAGASITDNGTAGTTPDTLAAVSLTGFGAASTVSSDALSKISLIGATAGGVVTITNNTAAHTLNVSVSGNVAGSGIIDAVATTVNIDAAAKSSQTITTAAATAVKFTGAGLNTIAQTFAAAAVLDASTDTGGVVLVNSLVDTQQFTGGAGADTITTSGTGTKVIDMGAGNDTVNGVIAVSGSAVGTGGSIAGGAGTDVFGSSAASFANVVDATTGGKFAAGVTGFETVKFTAFAGANAAADATFLNANAANSFHTFEFGADVGAFTETLNNLTSGDTIQFDVAQTGTVAANVLNALTSTTDILNVKVTGAAGYNAGTLTSANVETLNINSFDSATTPSNITHTITIADTAAKAIVVTGNAGLVLSENSTALTSVDASGLTVNATAIATTQGLTLNAAVLGQAATFTGSGNADTFNLSAQTKAMTVTAGAGNDTIITGTGADVIDAGTGNDSINSGTGPDIITTGAGTDTVTINTNTNVNIYATVTDAAKGDMLDFADKGAATFTTAKVVLAGTATFQDYANAVAVGDGSAAGKVGWFQFGGDTYVAEDLSLSASFVNGTDQIVKLTGLIDLSTSTLAGATSILTV